MPPIDPTDLNKVKLLIGWYGWRNWQDIRISRSIEAAASDFVLSFTVHPKQTVRRFEIYPGDPCTVSIGPDLVITGHVDDVSQSYDAHHRTISVSGRSLTADLIDFSAREVPGTYYRVNLEEIASKLAEPYCVPVRAEVDTGPDLRLFKVHPGESVHAAIERHARANGIILTDDSVQPAGDYTVVQQPQAAGPLIWELRLTANGGGEDEASRRRYLVRSLGGVRRGAGRGGVGNR